MTQPSIIASLWPAGHPDHPHLGCPIIARWYVSPSLGTHGVAGMRVAGWDVPHAAQVLLPVHHRTGDILWTALAHQQLGDMSIVALDCLQAFVSHCLRVLREEETA